MMTSLERTANILGWKPLVVMGIYANDHLVYTQVIRGMKYYCQLYCSDLTIIRYRLYDVSLSRNIKNKIVDVPFTYHNIEMILQNILNDLLIEEL